MLQVSAEIMKGSIRIQLASLACPVHPSTPQSAWRRCASFAVPLASCSTCTAYFSRAIKAPKSSRLCLTYPNCLLPQTDTEVYTESSHLSWMRHESLETNDDRQSSSPHITATATSSSTISINIMPTDNPPMANWARNSMASQTHWSSKGSGPILDIHLVFGAREVNEVKFMCILWAVQYKYIMLFFIHSRMSSDRHIASVHFNALESQCITVASSPVESAKVTCRVTWMPSACFLLKLSTND